MIDHMYLYRYRVSFTHIATELGFLFSCLCKPVSKKDIILTVTKTNVYPWTVSFATYIWDVFFFFSFLIYQMKKTDIKDEPVEKSRTCIC